MERLTELEVINRMLLGIRLAPVATVDELDSYSEGMIARGILRQVMLDVLIPGWNFNTRRLVLQPSPEGLVQAPSNTIDIFVPQTATCEVMMDTDGYLINLSSLDMTKVFAGPVDCYVVLGMDWGQLPAPLQSLVLHKARLAFKLEMKSEAGADTSVIMQDIQRAEAAAKSWDLRQKRASMLDTLRMRQHVNPSWPRGAEYA